MIAIIKNTVTKRKKQPIFLFPSLKYLAPFSKNKIVRSVSVISEAMLDCSKFEDESYINTQIAGNIDNIERPEMINITSLKYLGFI